MSIPFAHIANSSGLSPGGGEDQFQLKSLLENYAAVYMVPKLLHHVRLGMPRRRMRMRQQKDEYIYMEDEHLNIFFPFERTYLLLGIYTLDQGSIQ